MKRPAKCPGARLERPAAAGTVSRVDERTGTLALGEITVGFPGWHIWRGRDRRGDDTDWHATRRQRLSGAQIQAGMLATLTAGSPASLSALLEQQEAVIVRQDSAA